MVLLDLRTVGSRTHVETVGPRLGDDFDKVVVTLEIFGQQDEVVAALVGLALLVLQPATGDVDFAADDRLECGLAAEFGEFLFGGGDFGIRIGARLLAAAQCRDAPFAIGGLVLAFAFGLLYVIIELLDSEHIAVIRHGDSRHAVGHGLVHQMRDAGLSVENRILGVYVQMYEIGHNPSLFIFTKIGIFFEIIPGRMLASSRGNV